MDGERDNAFYQGVTNWLVFGALATAVGAYYYTTHQPRAGANARRQLGHVERRAQELISTETSGSDSAKKRKALKKPKTEARPTPVVAVQAALPDDHEEEQSNKQFAEQMMRAKEGTKLSAPKSKENFLKTVKQSSAKGTPVMSPDASSQDGAEADDDLSPVASPTLKGGDVSDMLEPKASGPSTLRLTAPTQPVRQTVQRQRKEEVVESKKQRQNRLKKERERAEREAQEKERKLLEEKTRRAAREARGEPAKNGIPIPKPPASNAWTAPKPAQQHELPLIVNGSGNGQLLDTFDAESTASSTGGMQPSTAATSTSGADSTERDVATLSEEEQYEWARKQSEDDSGWTTAASKRQQKKKAPENGDVTPVPSTPAPQPAPAAAKPATSGKTNGFAALNDHYEQRTDVDPTDASNWDA
ncbi:hypothetical protein Tdes44962_MAKER03071 [Teratosphaeria destructans]|uniref:Uncharacterized protein n=1 Tax=Teratosphaeria destructans TaxID=418781 RepID=A0A9W7SR74_9PEZI|nr:hypothetical protein Tdes44962_MAKER03071 [Teratosphaeria destructans]